MKKPDEFRMELLTPVKSKQQCLGMIKKDRSYMENKACRSNFPISCMVTFRYKRAKRKFWATANKSKLKLLETSFIKMLAAREHTLITAIIVLPEACRCLLYTRNTKDLIFCINCLQLNFRKYFFITCCEPDSLWEIYDAL